MGRCVDSSMAIMRVHMHANQGNCTREEVVVHLGVGVRIGCPNVQVPQGVAC